MEKLYIKKIFILVIFFIICVNPGITFSEEKDYFGNTFKKENKVYLGLNEVCKVALFNNFDIQMAQFDTQIAKTELAKVKSVFDTFLNADTSYKEVELKNLSSFKGSKSQENVYNLGVSKKTPTGTKIGINFTNQRSWSNSQYNTINPAYESRLSLSLTQDLGKNFFGIQDRADVKITKLNIKNAEYTSLNKIEKKLAEVQKTYWNVALYLNVVKIRNEMLQEAKKLYRINKDRIKRGIIEKPQLLSSDANVEQKRIDLKLARNKLFSSLNKMKFLLNLEEKDKYIIPKGEFSLSDSHSVKLTEALKIAFNNRRDYQKIWNKLKSNRINLVKKRNNLFPEVNLKASLTRNGLEKNYDEAVEAIGTENNPGYFVGLELSFPLENRKAESGYEKTQLKRIKSLLQLKKLEQKILVDVRDAVRNTRVYKDRLKRQKDVVELQRKKLNKELQRYKHGRSDTDTVIRYQNDLLLAKLRYKKAFLDYKHSLINLSLKQDSLLSPYWKDKL